MADPIKEPQHMPVMRRFELWMKQANIDPDPHDLMTIILTCYVHMRQVMPMQTTMDSIELSLHNMEHKLREGLPYTDPATLEPLPFTIHEYREEMGEVAYREFVRWMESVETPTHPPTE